MIALGAMNTTRDFNVRRSVNKGNLGKYADEAMHSDCPWGIYADSQEAAKTLAVAFCYTLAPNVE